MARLNPLWPLMMPVDEQGLDSLCAVSANGVRVTFANGRTLLCGTSGLWNSNLGYGNPAIAEAAGRALTNASYLPIWGFEHAYARNAAAALIELAGAEAFARVIFSTSGGAANDTAMKLVRHYHALQDDFDRRFILGLRGGFHGMTFGAFALTSAQLGQRLYGVDRRLVGHVQPNCADQLEDLLGRIGMQVAAIVVEPVIGTGAIPLDAEFIEALLKARREYRLLLVADEIATGFGRIGPGMFATAAWPEPPDVLIVAKGMTNGTQAASAILVSQAIAAAFMRDDVLFGHAETQAGTPVVGASILATIAEFSRLDALAKGAALSNDLDAALTRLELEIPLVVGRSGAGCLRAVRLGWPDGSPLAAGDIDAIVVRIREVGALVHPGPSCIQIIPALVYSPEELSELIDCVAKGIGAFAGDAAAVPAGRSGPC